ncbi:retropepsin-like aspartic protease family protein [Sphingomonas sp. MM-1]|uniref:retropepsin-like aspartic protease family protein n=1 Tax=Sphingomonas sp. MM-1 TaxID=745310 RepID=UPI000A59815B|nr:TIGR02281 family clan AA aspartic protease [Sphingomonas sp. MM-1]
MSGRLPLLFTILAGAALGWLLPYRPSPDPAPPAEPTARAAPAVADRVAAPPAATSQRMPEPPRPAMPAGPGIVIERRADGHYYADALVNGRQVHFLVDTGASGVVLTMDDARRVGLPFNPYEFSVIGKGASGDVRGKLVTIDRIVLGHVDAAAVPGAIIGDGARISLLGQSFLSRIGSVSIADGRMTLR